MTQINKNQDLKAPSFEVAQKIKDTAIFKVYAGLFSLPISLKAKLRLGDQIMEEIINKDLEEDNLDFKVSEEEFENHDCHRSKESGCEVCHQYFHERGQI